MIEKVSNIADMVAGALVSLNDHKIFAASGHNGPYFDIETPVRNTSHWVITYSILYLETGDESYEAMAKQLLDYLMGASIYEKNQVLIHRQKTGKDWCNGVIGQAWGIEALVVAGHILGRDDALQKAHQLAGAFDFSFSVAAWVRKDPYTGKAQIDYTLNHQLWYAAALAMLDEEQYDTQINHFLDALNAGGLRLRRSGCINHLFFANSPKAVILRARYKLAELKRGTEVHAKELGYHLYNLHPLARLRQKFGGHALFSSDTLRRAVGFAFSESFMLGLEDNKFAYPYNAPAFEYPSIARVFHQDDRFVERAWEKQIEKTFDESMQAFYKNCPDPLTLNARIYEYLIDSFYMKLNRERS